MILTRSLGLLSTHLNPTCTLFTIPLRGIRPTYRLNITFESLPGDTFFSRIPLWATAGYDVFHRIIRKHALDFLTWLPEACVLGSHAHSYDFLGAPQ